jgi:serine/threonine protein kinase
MFRKSELCNASSYWLCRGHKDHSHSFRISYADGMHSVGKSRSPQLLQIVQHHRQGLFLFFVSCLFVLIILEHKDCSIHMVCERMDCDLLDHVIDKMPLHEDTLRDFLSQICSGVEYLHGMRIAHRDLKLENVVVRTRRDGSVEVRFFPFSCCSKRV